MDIEELQDFVDWEIKRKGGKIGNRNEVIGNRDLGAEFGEAVVDICVLARRQGIDIVDAIATRVEEIRKKG